MCHQHYGGNIPALYRQQHYNHICNLIVFLQKYANTILYNTLMVLFTKLLMQTQGC